MMNKETLGQSIREKIRITEEKIMQLKEQSRPISPENSLGRISRMDAINNKSVIEASLREAVQQLQQLNVALDKLPLSDFGICIQCKQPIPEGRLMLMPQAAKCVNCA